MLKARELREGNLTYLTSSKDGSRCEHSIVISDLVSIKLGKKIFKPIPLTKEKLVKFGFEYNKEDNAYQGKAFHIEARKGGIKGLKTNPGAFGVWWVGGYLREIDYVHQLQNLYFALTGSELTIK